ncbi:hypothetical protein HKD37_20G055808 [Glycine soja]
MIFHSPLLQTPTQTLTPSFPPPTTIGGHHEPSLLAAKCPDREEPCNRTGILKILLKDSVEKTPSIPPFVASLR